MTGSSSRTRTVLLLGLFMGAAAALRLIPYHAVFGGETVSFIETDAWYHMRLVDALVRDFPHRIWFDPYLRHPGGDVTNVGPFFDWIIAGLALLLGGGAPSERLTDQVGALMPVAMGAVTVVPVYILGKELFSRRTGLWAAAIVGILPGQIFVRSLLGFTDHHCAEVLFSSLALMCLVLALRPDVKVTTRISRSVWFGLLLGCYLLTWSGGAMLLMIIAVWAVGHSIVDGARGRTSDQVLWAMLPGFLITGLMVLPWLGVAPPFRYQLMVIAACVPALLFLRALGAVTFKLKSGRLVYWTALGIAAGAAFLLLQWKAHDAVQAALGQAGRLSPARQTISVVEATPLLRSADAHPFPLWNQFTTSLLFAAAGIVSIGLGFLRRPTASVSLFITWTLGMVAATVGQVRFSYYLAVNVAIAAAVGCVWIESRARGWTARVPGVLALLLAGVILVPNAGRYTKLVPDGPSPAWTNALLWMSSNTPDPFGDPDWYYTTARLRSSGRDTPPGASYGVMSWWDFGYWIVRLGRRVPIANPMQSGARDAASFLLAQDESQAAAVADRTGSRYVIVNSEIQARQGPDGRVMSGFFEGLVRAAGQRRDQYFIAALRKTPSGPRTTLLYFPSYYQTMMSRLYLAVRPPSIARVVPWVVTLRRSAAAGYQGAEIVDERQFSTYAEAQAFVQDAHSDDVLLVGEDPLVSCIPLEPFRNFVRVHQSVEVEDDLGKPGPPVVQVFERIGARAGGQPR